MVLNSWKNVTMICGNHGNDCTHEMQIKESLNTGHDTAFFVCPEYKSIYGDNHEGKSCNNRLTVKDYMGMLEKLEDMAFDGAEEADLTGYKWKKAGVEYEVLDHTDGHFTVKMRNRKAIAK